MLVIRRFHVALTQHPGWLAEYALVEVRDSRKVLWLGTRRPTIKEERDVHEEGVKFLKAALPGAEVYAVYDYEVVRRTRDGRSQAVKVRILDEGYGSGTRFQVSATSDDGKRVGGNAHASLETAIMTVHWGELG